MLDGAEVLRISVFCALDDVGPGSLATILAQKLGNYRQVHLVEVGDVRNSGFEVLATFDRPHHTLPLPSEDMIEQLLAVLGREQANPSYGQKQRPARRRPR